MSVIGELRSLVTPPAGRTARGFFLNGTRVRGDVKRRWPEDFLKAQGGTMSKKQKRKTKRELKAEQRAATFQRGAPTAEQIARGRGTPGMLGALMKNQPPRAFIQVHAANILIENCKVPGVKLGGNARVTGGSVGAVHADDGARIVLDGGVIVGEGARVSVGAGATIEAKDAFLGDRYVTDLDLEVAAHQSGDMTSAHVSSSSEMVVSALGQARGVDTDADHRRVGEALATHVGKNHEVRPEETRGGGAEMRDGQLDPQVDVLLLAENPTDDVWLQVVRPAAMLEELGKLGSAVDLVVNDQTVTAAIAQKEHFADKHLYELAVSVPVRLSGPMRRGFTTRAENFGVNGWGRVWLVDDEGWVLQLGPRQAAPIAVHMVGGGEAPDAAGRD